MYDSIQARPEFALSVHSLLKSRKYPRNRHEYLPPILISKYTTGFSGFEAFATCCLGAFPAPAFVAAAPVGALLLAAGTCAVVVGLLLSARTVPGVPLSSSGLALLGPQPIADKACFSLSASCGFFATLVFN